VPLPSAFNLFTLLTCLLAPLSIWLAARVLAVGRRAELIALGFAVLIWHFDSTVRFCWTAGMVSFATVGHLAILVLALFHRFLRRGQGWALAALAVLLPLSLLTHVWAFGTLAIPMTALYVRHWRRLPLPGHLQVWGLAALAVVANLYWLGPALHYFHFISPSGVVGQANPLYVLTDWLELLVSPINTGFVMPHTLFRFAVICGAVVTLWRWRRDREEGDDRFFVGAVTLGWLFGLAYVAALIPGLRETEPYRFIIPGILFAVVCASPSLARLSWRELRALPRLAQGLLVVAAILILPRVGRQVMFFIPELMPQTRLPVLVVNQSRVAATGLTHRPASVPNQQFMPRSWRLRGIDDTSVALARYLEQECTEPGRVLVQHWAFGEYLRWATAKPIVGGFPDRRLVHEAAYVFHRPWDPRFHGKELADYLVRYNIRYLVVTDPVPTVEGRRDLLEPRRVIGMHRVYRVRHFGNYFAAGSGEVEAGLNRIEVRDAKPTAGAQALTLRFHHMDTLRCRPGCAVVKQPIPHDPVGFITVRATGARLPERFVIEHRY